MIRKLIKRNLEGILIAASVALVVGILTLPHPYVTWLESV